MPYACSMLLRSISLLVFVYSCKLRTDKSEVTGDYAGAGAKFIPYS